MSVTRTCTYFREIWFLLGRDQKRLPLLFAFFLSISIIDILGIGLVGPYITLFIDPGSLKKLPTVLEWTGLTAFERHSLIAIVGCGLVLVFGLKAVAGILLNNAIFRFSRDRGAHLSVELMHTYMNMPYESFLISNSAKMLHTAHELVAQFIEQAVVPTLRIASEGLIAICVFCFLAYINGYALILIVCIISPLICIYVKISRSRMLAYGELANLKMGIAIKALKEGFSGLKEIRILGAEKYYCDLFEDGVRNHARYLAKAKAIITAPRYLLDLTFILLVVGFSLGAIQFAGKTSNVLPLLGMFGVAAMRIIPSANLLITGISQLRVGRHATHVLYQDLSKMLPHVKSVILLNKLSEFDARKKFRFSTLELRNIYFRYSNSDAPCLDNVSLTIAKGNSIGIIGHSGSGKTTLVDVMLGLLNHQQGEVIINGMPIEQGWKAWRSVVAYLPQRVFISDSSLRSNVALGVPDDEIDDSAVWDSIKKAWLTEFVKTLPQRLKTRLGENGARLSGGQRQRIALARAFYLNRQVLIMDEATSALDTYTEQAVLEAIKSFHGKKTVIIIAHRMSTVKNCEKIYRLVKGQIQSINRSNQ